ncbi:hypothetical protein BGW41_004273 [Actinomortierella wolfii]|nr:hypothetical protein BGW41_004273 [Actinomortierella wolfii]
MPRSVKSSNLNRNSSNGRRQQPKAREAVAGDEMSTRGINNRSVSEAKSAAQKVGQSSGFENIQAAEESTEEDDSYNDSDSYYSDSYYSDSYYSDSYYSDSYDEDDNDSDDNDYDDVFSGEDFSDVGENSDDDEDDDAESQTRPIAPEVLEAIQGMEQSATNKAIDADSPKWAYMGFFDLLEYMVYSGNGFSRGDFEKDDQN